MIFAFCLCFRIISFCGDAVRRWFSPLLRLLGEALPVHVWRLHKDVQHGRKPADTPEDSPGRVHLCLQSTRLWKGLPHILQPQDPCTRSHEGEAVRVWCARLWEGLQYVIQVIPHIALLYCGFFSPYGDGNSTLISKLKKYVCGLRCENRLNQCKNTQSKTVETRHERNNTKKSWMLSHQGALSCMFSLPNCWLSSYPLFSLNENSLL